MRTIRLRHSGHSMVSHTQLHSYVCAHVCHTIEQVLYDYPYANDWLPRNPDCAAVCPDTIQNCSPWFTIAPIPGVPLCAHTRTTLLSASSLCFDIKGKKNKTRITKYESTHKYSRWYTHTHSYMACICVPHSVPAQVPVKVGHYYYIFRVAFFFLLFNRITEWSPLSPLQRFDRTDCVLRNAPKSPNGSKHCIFEFPICLPPPWLCFFFFFLNFV